MFTATDRSDLEKLTKNLACYNRDLTKEGEYVLNADKLGERIRMIEGRQMHYSRDGDGGGTALTADEVLRRFSELYTLLKVDRVQEPYGTLRPRP